MVDILERLQSPQTSLGTLWPQPNLHEDAADEITRLRAELTAAQTVASEHETDAIEVDEERFVAWAERDRAVAERDALREENARLRRLVKTAYAEGCYDSTKTEKTQEEFEALWQRTFSYKIISGRGKAAAIVREGETK